MPEFLRGRDAVVWSRSFSPEDARKADCELLRETLSRLSRGGNGGNGGSGAGNGKSEVRRMVMGHTIQERGVNAACGGRALRVDVGLSAGCGDGRVEVLEIVADGALPGSVRRLVEVEVEEEVGRGEGAMKKRKSSRVAAVPGVGAALGGGGGLPSLEQVDEGVEDDERSRWRIWSWWKGSGGGGTGGGRATPPPPEPTPTAVSAAA